MRKTENFTHQLTKTYPKLALWVISNHSTSLHSIIVRRVIFRSVFSPLISTSCIRRVVFDKFSAYRWSNNCCSGGNCGRCQPCLLHEVTEREISCVRIGPHFDGSRLHCERRHDIASGP